MHNIKASLKRIIRNHLPYLYPAIYRAYFNLGKFRIDKNRVKIYSNFLKSGFYKFCLNKTEFDIMLDPENGGVDMEIFADKYYEPKILELIKNNLNPNSIFIDIGANIGQHSLYASFFCKHVYSFEPVQKLYNQFTKSVFRNSILNITAYNYALGNKAEELPIYSNGSSLAASSLVSTITNKNRDFLQKIKVFRLDDIYKKVGIDRADFIKIDVEGYELEVLLGAKEFIKSNKPKILIEFSPYFYRRFDKSISHKIIDFFIQSDYQIFDLGEQNEDRIEINSLQDIRNNDQTNLLCVPKKIS